MRRRLTELLLRWLSGRWITGVLVIAIAGMVGTSLGSAEWVENSRPVMDLIFMGVGMGALLAASRLRGWLVAVYSLALSLLMTFTNLSSLAQPLLQVGRVPFAQMLDEMHLNLVMFSLRVQGWWQASQHGVQIRDTGLFVFCLAVLLFNATIWLVFWTVRRRQALVGGLPYAAILSINVHLSQQPNGMMASFYLLLLLLVLRTVYLEREVDWNARKVDYPEDIFFDWLTGGAVVAVLVVTISLGVALVGTPQGWRSIANWVEKSRQTVSTTATQYFGGVKPPPPSKGPQPLPSIQTPNMARVGVPLASGSEPILYVGLSDSPPLPEDFDVPVTVMEVPRHYWRSQILGTYTGQGWVPVPLSDQEVASRDLKEAPPGRYLLKQTFVIAANHGSELFSVSQPVTASQGVVLRGTQADGSTLAQGRLDKYELVSLATDVTIQQMQSAGDEIPAAVRELYGSLPANIPTRVKRLADEVVRGAVTPYEKAVRIQDYLRKTYPYDLTITPPKNGQDVVDYFLFEAPGGFCTYYASAMAVMLRMEGVPARVATGYAMGVYDRTRGMYRVTASASHAWVEVYFPGLDWVEFEPTAGFSTFNYRQGQGPSNLNNEKVAAAPQLNRVSPWVWLGGLLAALVGLWGANLWSRQSARRLLDTVGLSTRHYLRVRRELNMAGAPGRSSLTPDEFQGAAAGLLADYPQVDKALQQATRLYCQAVFSPRSPSPRELRITEWNWRLARLERFRLVMRHVFGKKAEK